MSRRHVDPLETIPGRLRAFACELVRITQSGDWIQITEAAAASPWFQVNAERCACCGALGEQSGLARAGELVQGDIKTLFQGVWVQQFRQQEEAA